MKSSKTSTTPVATQALVPRGVARRLMLAFSGRWDADAVGTGPVGHWHYRLWSYGGCGARDLVDQPALDVDPRRQRTQLTTG
jgi:hypothetical protein